MVFGMEVCIHCDKVSSCSLYSIAVGKCFSTDVLLYRQKMSDSKSEQQINIKFLIRLKKSAMGYGLWCGLCVSFMHF